MAYLAAHWQSIALGILSLAEVASLFLPKASGTLAGIVSALASLPGVKDPKIGQ